MQRYSRHIVLPEIGPAGQQALRDARVGIVGLGGLGCPAALYLASSGVGGFWLADYDRVEESNLQRQVLFGEADVGRRKAEAARDRLLALDSSLDIQTHHDRLDEARLPEVLRGLDVLLDCSDNFRTRFALNRAACAARCALVVAAAIRTEGQLVALRPGRAGGPCYACIFGEHDAPAEACEDAGVMAPVVGVVGTLAAQLATQLLLGRDDGVGILYRFEGLALSLRSMRIPPDPACPVCAQPDLMS